MQQVLINMLVIKDILYKVFDYIDLWGENLKYIAWEIRASYPCTIKVTSGQASFVRDRIFNLASGLYWQVTTAEKQRHVDMDNIQENARRVKHDYANGILVYVEMTGIYRKLDYSKQVLYRITAVVSNGKF